MINQGCHLVPFLCGPQGAGRTVNPVSVRISAHAVTTVTCCSGESAQTAVRKGWRPTRCCGSAQVKHSTATIPLVVWECLSKAKGGFADTNIPIPFYPSVHFLSLFIPHSGSRGVLQPIPAILGRRWGTPWTSQQIISEPTQRDNQHTHIHCRQLT